METELKSHLLTLASRYAAITGLATSTIGMRAARDARFFDRLNEGGGFTVKTYDNVLGWFSQNWPKGSAWPVSIPRPTKPNGAAA